MNQYVMTKGYHRRQRAISIRQNNANIAIWSAYCTMTRDHKKSERDTFLWICVRLQEQTGKRRLVYYGKHEGK